MADVAIISDFLAVITLVFTIVAAKTSGRSDVTDIVGVGLPVGLHFREKVALVDALHFRNRSVN